MNKDLFPRIGTVVLVLLLGGLVVSCSALPLVSARLTPSPGDTGAPTASAPTQETTQTPAPTTPVRKTLILWVPPQFDPSSGTEAGELLQEQLSEFSAQRPQLDIQVRVKSLEGSGGMLDTLQTAQDAAPRVLPDLVILDKTILEEAVQQELIQSSEELAELMASEDWYSLANSLASTEGEIYGVPFAGDVLTLAYKSDLTEDSLADWGAVLEIQKALSFPAADPDALITLALYESEGGDLAGIDDSRGLDQIPITHVLNFYQSAASGGVMPYWLTQFETDQQAWEAYRERQSTLTLTWISNTLILESQNTSLAPFPTRDGVPFTYGTGWSWAVTNADPAKTEAAAALVQELVEAEFLASWTSSLGYVPLRPSSLDYWEGGAPVEFLGKILPSAVEAPPQRLQESVGPLLRDAVLSVLKDQADPGEVVELLQQRLKELP